MDQSERWLISAVAIIILLIGALFYPVFAQAPNHPEHGAEHFYNTWMMPEDRTRSCCSKRDCGPAEAKRVNGQWFARWAPGSKPEGIGLQEGNEWVPIPEKTIEHDRDLPDGGAHLCMTRIGGEWLVLCFAAGAGG